MHCPAALRHHAADGQLRAATLAASTHREQRLYPAVYSSSIHYDFPCRTCPSSANTFASGAYTSPLSGHLCSTNPSHLYVCIIQSTPISCAHPSVRTAHHSRTQCLARALLRLCGAGRYTPRGRGRFGNSHFIEHLSFKGTTHRRACHIVNGLERVQVATFNAYTTKQETILYATVRTISNGQPTCSPTLCFLHSTLSASRNGHGSRGNLR